MALLGILFERFILRRFYTADPILSLLVTFGLALVAEQAIRMIWGAAPLPASMPAAFKGNVVLGDFLFSRYRLFLLAVVAAVLGGHLAAAAQDLLRARGARRHPAARHGRGARHPPAAVHDDHRHARRGHGGAGRAPCSRRSRMVHPAMGAEIITVAFVVVVIGGLGSFWGVVLAALLVGVVRGITIHFVPAAGEASMYVLMFLVLHVPAARPARRAHREVRMKQRSRTLLVGALALVALPFAMHALGLSIEHGDAGGGALAIAALGLNLLVGYHRAHLVRPQRLVRHRRLRRRRSRRSTGSPGQIVLPLLFVDRLRRRCSRRVVGLLILRRRGVYFALLTLAFAALTYAIAFRWTALTGGEDGLGGLEARRHRRHRRSTTAPSTTRSSR